MFADRGPYTLNGAATSPIRYLVSHDESGDVHTDPYFAVGVLFIPEQQVPSVLGILQQVRRRADYDGEVHFNQVRSLPSQLHGAKTAVAEEWLNVLPALTVLGLRAYVMVVNREAHGFDGHRMPTPRHLAYNRYTRMGFESALAWLFPERAPMIIRGVSDAKHRMLPGSDDEFVDGDNFVEYLPRAVAWRAVRESAWPTVTFEPAALALIDTTLGLGTFESELLQLTDVLVSASRAAISGRCSKKPAKRLIAHAAMRLIEDTAREPWLQLLDIHRKIGFGEFQGAGWANPVVPRLVRAGADQEELPFR